MKVLVITALFLALTVNGQTCHIQNYDGPIYVAPHLANDKNLHHIGNNNVGTTCDNDCDCVTKQLTGYVPINSSPQNSGSYNCRTNCNKFGTCCNSNNNLGTTSCSSTNCNNHGDDDAITIYIYDESDKNCGCGNNNGCGTCWNSAGTTFNNDRTSYNNAGTTYNNAGTSYNNAGTSCNNDATTGIMGTNYNHYYVPLYTKVGIPSATAYGYGKKNSSCPKCGCSIAN